MKFFLASIGIFSALAFSRFIPHPPNFTSLIALSFYVPAILGLRYLPILIISFAITDLFIGYHTGTHWTWGSVVVIGLVSQYFNKNINFRFIGALFGASIFFLITNLGVWLSGGLYEFTLGGLITCFTLALPFFGYTAISTVIFSAIIEIVYKFYKNNIKILNT